MAGRATARAELEALLGARQLDRTIGRANLAAGQGVLATGLEALDAALGGGLPRGELSDLHGPRSSGRTSLLCAVLGATTARGELAALVDAADMLDPESASAAGIQWDRLLWVRGDALSRHAPAPAAGRVLAGGGRFPAVDRASSADSWVRLLDRAVKAVNLVLQAGSFDLVALDLAEVPQDVIRRLPMTTWFRLQRVIEGGRTACLVVAPVPVGRSAGGVRIELGRTWDPGTRTWDPASAGFSVGSRWSGTPGAPRRFLGLGIEARVVRARSATVDTCRVQATA